MEVHSARPDPIWKSRQECQPVSAERILPEVQDIDLALSGGGFRATLFHLGVIGYLRDTHNLLDRLRNVCSVSGGSILAAHLVINWAEYTNADIGGFRERARALTDAIRSRDISGDAMKKSRSRLLRLAPLDADHLITAYDELLKAKSSGIRRWDDFRTSPTRLPSLHVLATHLNTGLACAFSPNGFDVIRSTTHPEDSTSVDDSHFSATREEEDRAIEAVRAVAKQESVLHQNIARSVAASSAFPPIFSPLPLDWEAGRPLHWLTDGGVYDNSGINYLKHLYTENKWTEKTDRLVIVSDAGRHFSPELGKVYKSLLGLASRVTDAQGNRIAEADSTRARTFFQKHHVRCIGISIHDRVAYFAGFPAAHSALVQKLAGSIRTELDTFTAEECLALYRHGYLVAQQALTRSLQMPVALTGTPWTPVDHVVVRGSEKRPTGGPELVMSAVDKDSLEKALRTGHINRKQRQLTNLAFKMAVGLLLIVAGVGVAGYFMGTRATEPVQRRIVAEGALKVHAGNYGAATWANDIPMLRAITSAPATVQPRFIYLLESDQIGVRTGQQPYEAAAVKVDLAPSLAKASTYFLLEEHSSDGNVRYLALRQHPDRTRTLLLPPGSHENRLRALVVSEEEVSMETLEKNVSLNLERP
jgi:predicted acylesterase/phospholipase RssA